MQLRETGAGEVTSWSSEMLATIGRTGNEEKAAQREERDGIMYASRKERTPPFSTEHYYVAHSITGNACVSHNTIAAYCWRYK